MSWNRTLFGDLYPSPDMRRRKLAGQRQARAYQDDLLADLPCLISPSGTANAPPIQLSAWIEGVCKAMGPDTDGLSAGMVGRRWSDALRRRFGGAYPAKSIAKATGCNVRTAEAWLAGQAPYLHTALAVAAQLRDPVLLFELAGIDPPPAVAIGRELDDMRADLDALGARIARLKAAGS